MRPILFFLMSSTIIVAQNESGDKLINPYGWGHLKYESVDNNDINSNDFYIDKIRFGSYGNVADKINYSFLYEFATTKAQLLQAWFDYNFDQALNFRFGQYKYPFGIENYPAGHYWKFISSTGITEAVTKKLGQSGASLRDIGLQVSGTIPLNDDFSFQYKSMLMNGSGINVKDENNQKDIAASIFITGYKKLTLGGSYYRGTCYNQTDKRNYAEYAYDFSIQYKDKIFDRELNIQGEFIKSDFKNKNGALLNKGYYVYYSQFIIDKQFEAGLRYDFIETEIQSSKKSIANITAALSYYFLNTHKISFNYSRDNSEAKVQKIIVQLQFVVS